MGGVINIITKKGGPEPFTSFTASVGDYNTRNYIFNHGGMAGKFNYWLTYGYRRSDGWALSDDFDEDDLLDWRAANPGQPDPEYPGFFGIGSEFNEDGGKRDLSGYYKRTLNLKIGYEEDPDDRTYLSFDYHNNERGAETEFYRYWRYTEWDQWHLNLVREKKFTDYLTIRARGFYVKHDDELTDVSWDEDHTTDRKWFEKSKYDDYSVGGELHTYWDFGKWSFIKAGINYIRDNHKQKDFLDDGTFSVIRFGDPVGWTPEEEYEADTWSIGAEDEIEFNEQLSMIVGASWDYWDPREAYDQSPPDSVDTFNPQIGFVYSCTDATTFHASVGKKTRFPNLFELYSEYGGGNPDLDEEQAINYDVGVEHFFSDTCSASLTFFYSDVEDLIQRLREEDEWVHRNVADATLYGVEAAFEMEITRELWFGANYTYQYAYDDDLDRHMENTPRHRFNADVRYWFPFGLTTTLQAMYTERQFEYYETETGGERARHFPDFFLMNAKMVQDLNLYGGLSTEIWGQVTNIFDQDYDEGRPMPGRNFLVGLTMRY